MSLVHLVNEMEYLTFSPHVFLLPSLLHVPFHGMFWVPASVSEQVWMMKCSLHCNRHTVNAGVIVKQLWVTCLTAEKFCLCLIFSHL